MDKQKELLIKKIFCLWETDRLHMINEVHSIEESVEMEEELSVIKNEILECFGIEV